MNDLPSQETSRLENLASFDILDTEAEQAFDDLAALAAQIFDVPIALISLVDAERQWFKAHVGMDVRQTDRSSSFCAHAILDAAHVMVVEDAMLDDRFAANPLVLGDPRIRFYAGAPIVTSDGTSPGTVCVIDTRPRTPEPLQLHALQLLARQAAALLMLRKRTREAELFARQRDQVVAASDEERRKSDELLALVLRGGDLGLWDLDPRSGKSTVNDREREMLGYGPHADVSQLDWSSLIHPDDVASQRAAFSRHWNGSTPFAESTHRLRRHDGRWIWVLDRSVIVQRDAAGRPTRVVGTTMDITEQRERDAERIRGGKRLELAVDAGGLGLWDLDVAAGRAVYSDRWWSLFGYLPDERPVVEGLWKSLVHPDDEHAARDALSEHTGGLTPVYEGEVRMRHKDGRWLWIQDRASVVERNEQGRALRVIGVSMNVTERKDAEAALFGERRRLQMITDNMPALITHIDLQQRYTFANAHHRRVFGFEPATLIGKTMRHVCGDPIYAGIAPYIEQALAGEAVQFEAQGPARGVTLDYQSNYIPDYDETGTVVGVYAMVFDISERKRAEHALVEEQRRLRLITDNLPALVTHVGKDQRYSFVNAFVDHLFGSETGSMIGRTMLEVRGPEIYARMRPHVERALQGERVTFELDGMIRGRTYFGQCNYLPDISPDGSVNGFYAMTFDVTPLKVAQLQSAAIERRLRGITDNVPALIAEFDRDMRFTFCNATYRDWLGIDPDTVIGERLVDAVGAAYYGPREAHLARALTGERVTFEQEVTLPIGERYLQTTYIPQVGPDGSVAGVYALTHDISELKDTQGRLAALAREDALTGLPNRRVFDEHLAHAMARTRRSGAGVAVLYLDLDRFKRINDTGGHAAGDAVLREFGRRLLQTVRRTDTVARYAGDEFIILLEGLDGSAEAATIAGKILAAMSTPIDTPGRAYLVSVSIGIALHRGSDETADALLAVADAALYQAKATGRNRFFIGTSPVEEVR